MKMRSATAVTAGCALAACAATGVKVTDEQLQTLKVGQTTVADVLQQLGPPTTRLRNADGTQTLLYVYGQTKVRSASFIPIVGLVAGGADSRSSTAMLRFDNTNKLLTVSSSESQFGTGVGVEAGRIDSTAIPQPRP